MKKLLFLLTATLVFSSCLKEGSNYIKYSGWIKIDSIALPDTARVGQTIDIYALGGAPNGCWSGLELQMQKQGDSLVYIAGTGTYESSDGICTEVYPTIDSVFTFKPADTGIIKFVGLSADNSKIVDSLVVLPALR
ncbi:MAG: hypothetical protein ACM3ME_08230 [Chloroflexota bacterium]|nr:hypothetical protein [Lentimicrobium sp.]